MVGTGALLLNAMLLKSWKPLLTRSAIGPAQGQIGARGPGKLLGFLFGFLAIFEIFIFLPYMAYKGKATFAKGCHEACRHFPL